MKNVINRLQKKDLCKGSVGGFLQKGSLRRCFQLPVRILGFFLFSVILLSCARKEPQEKIAEVNGSPVFLKSFQKEVALAGKRDPNLKITQKSLEDVLDTMIDNKLLVQEAVKRGLSEDERFLETIKTFWEQTLIRQLIDVKTREWSTKLFVTDEEIKRHYEKMRWRITVRLYNADTDEQADIAVKRMLNNEKAAGEETFGPLLVDTVQTNNALYKAFDLNAGQASVLKGEGETVAVQVIKKEAADLPPLEEVYNRIKADLIEHKKQAALDEWLDDIEKSARIDINAKLLKKVANER